MESRMQTDKDICYLCFKKISGAKECHHCLNGTAYRSKSEEDGLKVYLHPSCHRWLHDHPRSMWTFKQRAQRVYESQIGTRRQFIKRYGKNYLED